MISVTFVAWLLQEAEDYLNWRKRIDHVSLLGSCKKEQIDHMENFDHNQFGKFCAIGKIKCQFGIRPQAEVLNRYVV